MSEGTRRDEGRLFDFINVRCRIQQPDGGEPNILWEVRVADLAWVARTWFRAPDWCVNELGLRYQWSYGGSELEQVGVGSRYAEMLHGPEGDGARLDFYVGYDSAGLGIIWYDGYPPASDDAIVPAEWQKQHQAVLGWDPVEGRAAHLQGPEPSKAEMEFYGRLAWSWEPAVSECHAFASTLFLDDEEGRNVSPALFVAKYARRFEDYPFDQGT